MGKVTNSSCHFYSFYFISTTPLPIVYCSTTDRIAEVSTGKEGTLDCKFQLYPKFLSTRSYWLKNFGYLLCLLIFKIHRKNVNHLIVYCLIPQEYLVFIIIGVAHKLTSILILRVGKSQKILTKITMTDN